MAALMFLLFVILIFAGMPVIFSLGLASLFYLMNMGIPLEIIPQKIYSGIDSFTLLCIPGFILAGNLMNTGGITERIIRFCNAIIGHVRGGLAFVNCLDSFIFAGISGTAIADVTSLGAMMIPAMERDGYDSDFSVAITASTSVMGPIIPPSVPMVIAGSMTGVSVAKMFIGGVFPGVLLFVSFLVTTYIISKKRNYPKRERQSFKQIVQALMDSVWAMIMPPLLLIGISGGFFTPTEASVVIVVYAFIVGAFVYKELKLSEVPRIIYETVRSGAAVILLVGVANLFGWILASEQIPQQIAKLILGITTNRFLVILMVNIVLLFVGMFMESIAAIAIMFPVLLPVLTSVGLDPIHASILMVLNLMIGLLTPPVGVCLFFAASIGKVPLARAIKANMPYLAVCLIVLMLVSYVPFFTTFLPKLL